MHKRGKPNKRKSGKMIALSGPRANSKHTNKRISLGRLARRLNVLIDPLGNATSELPRLARVARRALFVDTELELGLTTHAWPPNVATRQLFSHPSGRGLLVVQNWWPRGLRVAKQMEERAKSNFMESNAHVLKKRKRSEWLWEAKRPWHRVLCQQLCGRRAQYHFHHKCLLNKTVPSSASCP